MHIWQLQEAKAKLSELDKFAESEGPQSITVHGQPVAVVISQATFEKLTGTSHSLIEFMQNSPLYGLDEIEFQRDQSLTREALL